MHYSYNHSFGFPSITPYVKGLVITNIAVWFCLILVIQQFFLSSPYVFQYLGLTPALIKEHGMFWQPLTYMFIHAQGLFHIFFNLIVLWMFGSELERLWGSKFFLIYYLFCGIGAAVLYCLITFGISIFSLSSVEWLLKRPVVGSSGSIFGLMAAYGLIFKNRIIYVMMVFPMRARTFTYCLIGIEILSMLNSGLSGPVANLAHLGGLASGFLFLQCWKNWHSISTFFNKKKRCRLRIVRPEDVKKSHIFWN